MTRRARLQLAGARALAGGAGAFLAVLAAWALRWPPWAVGAAAGVGCALLAGAVMLAGSR